MSPAPRDVRIGVACAIAVVLIWTFFIVLSRLGARGAIGVFDLAFLRFVFGALAVLPFFLRRPAGRRLGGLTAPRAAVLALFGALGFTGLAFAGFARAPAAHAAVLMPGTLPFSTALIALVVLGERITQRKALGLAAILCGVLLMAWHTLSDAPPGTWRGDLMFPLASVSWALFTVLSRRWSVDPLDATVAVPLFALAGYAPVYWLFLPKALDSIPPLLLLATGVFQGVFAFVAAMWAFSRVVATFGPIRTTMITAVAPVLAALVAVPVLGEPLSGLVVLGLAAVTIGMVVGVGGAPAPVREVRAAPGPGR